MRKFAAISVVLCMLFSMTAYASENGTNVVTYNTEDYENGEVFVMYTDGTYDVLTYETDGELSDALSKLGSDGNVLIAQPNYTYESTSLTSDTLSDKQWALYNDGSFYMQEKRNEYPVFDEPFGNEWLPWTWTAPDWFGRRGFRGFSSSQPAQSVKAQSGIDINVSEAWKLYNGGVRDVTVALVDTGIDTSHEDLQGVLWTNSGEIPDNGIDDDNNGYIDDVNGWNFYNNNNRVYSGSEDSHGTHGAGTIAATADNGKGIAGIVQSDRVKIMPVKALGGSDGSGSTASIIKAILYAEKNGASICNLSLGTSVDDKALYEVMKNSNMLFVVACGNDGADSDKTPCYPAAYDLDNIISVANIGYDGVLASSSNYGLKSVDIAAPGTYILSTTPDNSYSYMTGTSMSAPMVTGAAAMIYSQYGDISLADVKEIILSSAKKLDSLSGAVSSGGMLDLGAAMKYDTSKLTNGGWEVKTPIEYKGTAPKISAYSQYYGKKTYLIVQFYDEDGDIVKTAYADGKQSEEYFKSAGTEFEVDKDGTKTFEATEGIYTFYALDECGNETVYTVELKPAETVSQSPSGGRFDGIGSGFFGGIDGSLWNNIFYNPDPYGSIDNMRRIMNSIMDIFLR